MRAQLEHNMDVYRQKQQEMREAAMRKKYMSDIAAQIYDKKLRSQHQFNEERRQHLSDLETQKQMANERDDQLRQHH